jgi:catechol 2,3-dioxygenase-like lactoylglutathione lyase family enzyme
MLSKLDAVVIAVHDLDAAGRTFEALFDARVVNTKTSEMMNARFSNVHCGVNRICLATPLGPGVIQEHLDRWGEGLVGVAFASKEPEALQQRIESKGISVTSDEPGFFMLDPTKTHGLTTGVVPHAEMEKVGIIDFIYEVTHLVGDWKAVSDFWTDLFGLNGMKFSPIESKQYGYEGMLTLFDPPDKLDRIEVVYPHDTSKAMGKFFVKRGEGPYMCFMECEDIDGLRARLDAAGARYAPKEKPEQPNSLFIHPSSTHGVLIGVSPKNLAWVWSGRPELAKATSGS